MFFLGGNIVCLQNQAFSWAWFKAYQSHEGCTSRVGQADEEPIFPQIFVKRENSSWGYLRLVKKVHSKGSFSLAVCLSFNWGKWSKFIRKPFTLWAVSLCSLPGMKGMHFQLLTVSELLELMKRINNLQQEDEWGWENYLSMCWLQLHFSSSSWSGKSHRWEKNLGQISNWKLSTIWAEFRIAGQFCLSVTLLCKSANKIWQLSILFSVINYTWECIYSLLWICTDTLFFGITSPFCQTVFWNLMRS